MSGTVAKEVDPTPTSVPTARTTDGDAAGRDASAGPRARRTARRHDRRSPPGPVTVGRGAATGDPRVTASARDRSCASRSADHGIGIPARDLDRIFERFYRVDHGRSRDTGGTGLGLSIVRHVANNHQGWVDVESREGEGSTFTLVLPLQPERLP